MKTHKRCPECTESKSMVEFYNNKSMPDGKQPYCKSCWRGFYLKRREAQHRAMVARLPVDPRFVDFAAAVRKARIAHDMTQDVLGARVGVGGAQVRLWEKGKAYPQPKQRDALCAVLGLELPMSVRPGGDGRVPYEVRNCASPACGAPFPVYKRGVECCSRACAGVLQSKRQTGENNPSWSGGSTMLKAGYNLVKAPPDHPGAYENGYILEHRLVMEKILGRHLMPTEHVHHRNGRRADNRPENLELWKGKDPSGVRASDYHCPGCVCPRISAVL